MAGKLWLMTIGWSLALLLPVGVSGQEEGPKMAEELARPEIHLTREGHGDVNARRRMLAWTVSDPSGLAMVEVRIVKIEDVSMKPRDLYRSENPEGHVDLMRFHEGPGLYAILVTARDNERNENTAGLRFSYTKVREDCPAQKAWWPTEG